MAIAHSLGFPRIGSMREMKLAVESYWKGEMSEAALLERGQALRRSNWALQSAAGLEWITVGDFSWYDQVLDHSAMLGVVPPRFHTAGRKVDFTTYFQMARGRAPQGADIQACEMTKWFDTNYHYIVPEFQLDQHFSLSSSRLFDEIEEAQAQGYRVKPVLIGPLTYLWLGKPHPDPFDKLTLLPRLIGCYQTILSMLAERGIEWVQIDEPILVLDLPVAWRRAFQMAYDAFQSAKIKLLLTTYFGGLEDNSELVCELPVAGLHIDAVRDPEQVALIQKQLRPDCVLSVGIVNGRNVWKTDLRQALQTLKPLHQELGDRLWIAGSCSFLHCPVDLDNETLLDAEVMQWLAFAKQKTAELVLLARALNQGEAVVSVQLDSNAEAVRSRAHSNRIHDKGVEQKVSAMDQLRTERNPYSRRQAAQRQRFQLPLLPTTTIGSFPQTAAIRSLRRSLKEGSMSADDYENSIKQAIEEVIACQEQLGLDVLVHGEAERNDMVEYFGEQLQGFAFTQYGWVQSYGSRCVKPPIIYGDVSRPLPMTVKWSRYAQSLTSKPVKGMLTGPITMIMWSFVRDDQSPFLTAQQIALALREEVKDLEQAGIRVIQIDEPAFREGLPLRHHRWHDYLTQAVACFKLASTCVEDSTQIHTHMCYSEFNDIIQAIADLDADVLSIESCRSKMEILQAFQHFSYPNEIGPGVYDIHSPRIPTVFEIVELIEKAATLIPFERLWVNPDCGLKTRDWAEVEAALGNMVEAARSMRSKLTGL